MSNLIWTIFYVGMFIVYFCSVEAIAAKVEKKEN